MTDFAAEPEAAPAPARATHAPVAMEFAIEQLRLNPEISFGDLKARGQMDGVNLHPLTYRSAKERLELIPKRQRRPRARSPQAEAATATAPVGVPREVRVAGEEGAGVPAAGTAPATAAGIERVPGRRGRPFSPVMLFVLDLLREHPDLGFRDACEAAAKTGLAVTSAVYSRAKARLGLTRRRRRSDAGAGAQAKAVSAGGAAVSLDGVLASIRALESERDRLWRALDKIVEVIRAALR